MADWRLSSRLPATRDFAAIHGFSRGTVVQVFERLQSEGYLCSRVGAGTWISDRVTAQPQFLPDAAPPDYIRRTISSYERPKAFAGLTPLGPGAAIPGRPYRSSKVSFKTLGDAIVTAGKKHGLVAS